MMEGSRVETVRNSDREYFITMTADWLDQQVRTGAIWTKKLERGFYVVMNGERMTCYYWGADAKKRHPLNFIQSYLNQAYM